MGNICRSPTAEGVLRSKLQRAGLGRRVFVDSAGTLGSHAGEPPDPRSIAHAAARGYDLSAQRARPVRPDDFERFDWLLAMDEDNLSWLRQRAPAGAAERCALFLPFAGRRQEPLEVPDPYYGNPAGFDRVLDLLEDACDSLVAHMAQSPRLAPAGESGRA
ncbi:MAG: low molecular weight protein-tyrosine-phosphatase [Leptothrix sp. (in: b-proteobacteria)]